MMVSAELWQQPLSTLTHLRPCYGEGERYQRSNCGGTVEGRQSEEDHN